MNNEFESSGFQCPANYLMRAADASSLPCGEGNSNRRKCTESDCCVQISCANNDGANANSFSSNGFPAANCGPGKVRKSGDPICSGGICSVSECCEAMTCSNNNGVAHSYNALGFLKENCGAGKVIKVRDTNSDGSDDVTITCDGPGQTSCTASNCCEPMTCANSRVGSDNENFASVGGFKKSDCGLGKVLESAVSGGLSSLGCAGSSCQVLECCISMNCGNNNLEAYTHSSSGFEKSTCGAGFVRKNNHASIHCP